MRAGLLQGCTTSKLHIAIAGMFPTYSNPYEFSAIPTMVCSFRLSLYGFYSLNRTVEISVKSIHIDLRIFHNNKALNVKFE